MHPLPELGMLEAPEAADYLVRTHLRVHMLVLLQRYRPFFVCEFLVFLKSLGNPKERSQQLSIEVRRNTSSEVFKVGYYYRNITTTLTLTLVLTK